MSKRVDKEVPWKRPLSAEVVINDGGIPAESKFERAREVYAMMVAVHHECFLALRTIQQGQANLPLSELVDIQFALRESSKLADDLRKEFDATIKVQAAITCVNWAMDASSGGESIKGTHANGSPDIQTRVKVPTLEKEPEQYYQLMDWLGIPKDLQDQGKILAQEGEFSTEVVKVHYPGLQDMINRMQYAGYILPEFLTTAKSATWNEHIVRVTKKQDLL